MISFKNLVTPIKITQRLFIIFLTTAMFPILLLALLTYFYVAKELHYERFKQLQQTNAIIQSDLRNKLQGMEAELGVVSGWVLSKDLDKHFIKEFYPYFSMSFKNIALVLPQKKVDLYGVSNSSLSFSPAEYNFLNKGKTLLSVDYSEKDNPRLFMSRWLVSDEPAQGMLVAEINQHELWEFKESLPLQAELCIFQSDNQKISCHKNVSEEFTNFLNARAQENNTGHYFFKLDNVDHFVSYSRIPLTDNYFQSSWLITILEPKLVVLGPLANFNIIFPLVILLAFLLVLFLSLSQLRKRMTPLHKLLEGTRRIANRDFSEQVVVKSRDEFEELANSFNVMASHIKKQFNAFETMANIDRLILSSLEIDNIIEIVLTRMKQAVLSDKVGMILIDNEHYKIGRVYKESNHVFTEIHLKNHDLQCYHEEPPYVIFHPNHHVPDHLYEFVRYENQLLVSLPIYLENDLSAIIVLSYQEENAINHEDLHRAHELANRVGVALANARWQDQLYYQAHFDALTGLPNRLMMSQKLNDAIIRAKRSDLKVVVLYLDLDRFKWVNDSYGHGAGDLVIQETARRLKVCLRQVDTVSRLGGDEFSIIIPDLVDDAAMDAHILAVVSKLLTTCSEMYIYQETKLNLSASIGIAIYPEDGEHMEDLLKHADTAMYHAKQLGKNRYHFYSSHLTQSAVTKIDTEARLRQAIENDELSIYYQPMQNTRNGEIVGMEALLRWQQPNGQIMSPANFIPLAEETGLILPLTEWLLEKVCRQNLLWLHQGYSLKASINVSAQHFRGERLVDFVSKTLKRTGMEGKYLGIEITESGVMHDVTLSQKILEKLHELGVVIAIDDFGTGYSSMSYLRHFPIDLLKIDKSFIHGIDRAEDDFAIVKAMVVLAHTLGLVIVAEGIETAQQLTLLNQLGVDLIQGNLISAALDASKFENLLKGINKPTTKSPSD